MELYFYFLILYTTTVQAGTMEKIDILNSQPAIKGSSTTLACYISQFSNQDVVSIYKSELRVLTGGLPQLLTQCIPSICLTPSIGRYTFSSDSSHVYINITNLNRSEDQKWWTCQLGSQRKDIFLTIYTVPQTLNLDTQPNQDQDLSENAVTLKCSTGCTYPQPSFKWFYTEFGGSRQEWSTPGADTDTTGGCTDSERIYTSTLSLARYSSFLGNLNKTVKFTCGIPSFSGMKQTLYTNSSLNIQFTADPCLHYPCVRGTCFSHSSLFLCQCSKGYTGKLCEKRVNPCKPNPCQHGTCYSHDLLFLCQCFNGFAGKTCEKTVDPCQANPCAHGTCFSHGSDFLCRCQSGYGGERCEKIDIQGASLVG